MWDAQKNQESGKLRQGCIDSSLVPGLDLANNKDANNNCDES